MERSNLDVAERAKNVGFLQVRKVRTGDDGLSGQIRTEAESHQHVVCFLCLASTIFAAQFRPIQRVYEPCEQWNKQREVGPPICPAAYEHLQAQDGKELSIGKCIMSREQDLLTSAPPGIIIVIDNRAVITESIV